MVFSEYMSLFEDVISNPSNYLLYRDEAYQQYAKMNWTRTNRWLKRFEPDQSFMEVVGNLEEKQRWIIITEPWCGDAAHIIPILVKLAAQNKNIEVDIQLRDDEPFLIESYLTNGGKAIPILIIRDEEDNDIAVWGPRPVACQALFNQLKSEGAEFDEIKEAIQKWYNVDKGMAIQEEIKGILCPLTQ